MNRGEMARLPIAIRLGVLGAAALILSTALGGCASGQGLDLPDQIQGAPAVVRQAYAFAHDHPGVVKFLPCYCGCGSIGHTSNYDCYISEVDDEGRITYDDHALGCSICVDITLDAQRMLEEGMDLDRVRAQIDETYSPFGPSNMPAAQ